MEIYERFLGFYCTLTTDAESLHNLIISFIDSLKLGRKCLVGQGYDEAATMSGNKNGVATRITRDYPTACFIHCHSHRLNLALLDAASHYKETLCTLLNLFMQ